MEKIEFKSEINASPEQVWNILLGTDTYPKWTAAFAENSSVETDWQKGSKAIFGDGSGNGMVATIEENIPNKYLSIKHIGEIKDGKENLDVDWGPAFENYTLEDKDGKTVLLVDLNITAEWKDYFEKTWPKALAIVKELAEKSHINA